MWGSKGTTGGGLGTGIGVLVTLIQVFHPEWLGNRTWILNACFVWVGVCALIWLGQYRWFQRILGIIPISQMDDGKSNEKRIEAAGGIGGHAKVMQADTINLSESHNHSPSVPEAPIPRIKITAVATMSLRQDGLQWSRQYDGLETTVVWVSNHNEDSGQKAYPAEGIVASLQFRDAYEAQGYVQRVYWIDFIENHVDIKIGTSKAFLLGFFDEDKWAYYVNDRETAIIPAAQEEDFLLTRITFRMAPHRIPIREGLTVTVRVFSELTGVNFDKRTYFINKNGHVLEEVT